MVRRPRPVVLLAPRPCNRCTGTMVPASRLEAAGRTVAVLICWQCGADDPPLYRRATAPATVAAEERAPLCDWCGMPFAETAALHRDCAERLVKLKAHRRQIGRAMRQRIVS